MIETNLGQHAHRELRRAGLFKADGPYNGMLGSAALELVELFGKQGHSGMSAAIVRDLFSRLSNFENLTPITDDPAEWMEVAEGTWQSRRKSSLFSTDGGKTYYDINEHRGPRWLYERFTDGAGSELVQLGRVNRRER